MSEEVDRALRMLLRPSGDAGARRARGEALDTLLEHADEAHPQLLALARSDDPPLPALLALPSFGRPDSVPVLERQLREAPAPTTVVAAGALAEHPADSARDALVGALSDQRAQVVMSAALGLAERGDPRACDSLRDASRHEDAEVRERVLDALRRLGCS